MFVAWQRKLGKGRWYDSTVLCPVTTCFHRFGLGSRHMRAASQRHLVVHKFGHWTICLVPLSVRGLHGPLADE